MFTIIIIIINLLKIFILCFMEVVDGIGTQAFREVCGSSVSEAVETKSRDFVPDTSSDRKPMEGLKEGLNGVSILALKIRRAHTHTYARTR